MSEILLAMMYDISQRWNVIELREEEKMHALKLLKEEFGEIERSIQKELKLNLL